MIEPTSEWVGTPNFTPGRQGRSILAIVNHITAGYFPGCLEWLQKPASQASAHYLITRDGRIVQLVREGDTAWHAGIVNRPDWPLFDGTNPNRYTIGIEHVGMPEDGLTEGQYQATLALQRYLVAKYGLQANKDTVIGHYRIDSVNRPNCPGPAFPWERLLRDLRGEGEDVLDNLVVYADGDVGAALLLSYKLNCPMVLKDFAGSYPAKKKHWVGVQGTNDDSNSYYAGADRIATAKLGL